MANNPSVSQHVLEASHPARANAFTGIGSCGVLRVKAARIVVRKQGLFRCQSHFLSGIAFLVFIFEAKDENKTRMT
jgi:hypothetical protein